MDCENVLAQLDAYLDGELPAAEMAALDQHLRTCPACAASALGRVQLKRAVKNAGQRFAPSAAFRQAMQKQFAGKPAAPRWNFSWMLATAALSLLLALALVSGLFARRSRQQQLISELTDLHVATLASSTPVDVVSTDRHTVKPWFQGKIPFSFNLPELQNTEFQLVGGRVAYLGQTPGAHLIYQFRKHDVSVFIFPSQNLAGGVTLPPQGSSALTFFVESWEQSGLRYFVLGDVSPQEIRALASLFRAAATS